MQQRPQSEDATYVTKAQASFTELLDQREAIILDLDNLHYYTLNATAIFLWKQLRQRAAQTISETGAVLARQFAAAFKISAEQAERDVTGFLAELRGNGLIVAGRTETAQPSVAPTFDLAAWPTYETPQLRLSNSLTQVVLSGSSTIATAAIATGG